MSIFKQIKLRLVLKQTYILGKEPRSAVFVDWYLFPRLIHGSVRL